MLHRSSICSHKTVTKKSICENNKITHQTANILKHSLIFLQMYLVNLFMHTFGGINVGSIYNIGRTIDYSILSVKVNDHCVSGHG